MAVKVRWGTDSPRKRRTTWKSSSPSLTRSSFHDHLINISFVWYFERCIMERNCVFWGKSSVVYEKAFLWMWWEANKGVMIWFADMRIHNAYIAWLSRWLMDDSWVLKFKTYICIYHSCLFPQKTKWDRIYERHMYTCYRHGYWNATGLLNERHIAWYLSIKIYFHKNDMKISPPRSEG